MELIDSANLSMPANALIARTTTTRTIAKRAAVAKIIIAKLAYHIQILSAMDLSVFLTQSQIVRINNVVRRTDCAPTTTVNNVVGAAAAGRVVCAPTTILNNHDNSRNDKI